MLYHVVARGNEKQCIYSDDGDHELFLELLADALARFEVECASYCLMWNHYHLLLKPGRHPISRLMQQLNSAYCQSFNRRHQRVGHVLQGRFGSRIIEDGAYARTALRYIALNPVEAGYVADPKAWQWGSYRFTVGEDIPPDFVALRHVWEAFGTSDPTLGRIRFAEFVAAGLIETFENPLLHGSARLASLVAPLLEPHQHRLEHVYPQRYAARPSVGSLFDGMFSAEELDGAAYRAFCQHAYTLDEIGRVVGRDPSVVCRWIQRERRRREAATVSSVEDKRARNKI